jgi:hypothetical protein
MKLTKKLLQNLIKEQIEDVKEDEYRDFLPGEMPKVLNLIDKKILKQNLKWKKINDGKYEADITDKLPSYLKEYVFNTMTIDGINSANRAIRIEFNWKHAGGGSNGYNFCVVWAKKNGSYTVRFEKVSKPMLELK